MATDSAVLKLGLLPAGDLRTAAEKAGRSLGSGVQVSNIQPVYFLVLLSSNNQGAQAT